MATLENDIKVAEERIREMEKRRSYFAENMQKQENHFTRRWQRAKQI